MLQTQCKQSSCIGMMLMFLAVHRKHRVVHLQIPFVVESVIGSSALTRGLSITTLVRTSWALLPGVNGWNGGDMYTHWKGGIFSKIEGWQCGVEQRTTCLSGEPCPLHTSAGPPFSQDHPRWLQTSLRVAGPHTLCLPVLVSFFIKLLQTCQMSNW